MPKLYLPLPEVEKSITRPVVMDIVRQIIDITNSSKDTRILFLGDARSSAQVGSTVGANITENTKISSSEQMYIEVNEVYNENYLGTMAHAQTEQIPIFIDEYLGVVIKPIYTSRVFDITFRYRNPSKNRAKAWRDDIYMHVNQLRDVNLHVANYHYGIPLAYQVLLKEIHRLRENVSGYNESFDEYFLTNATTRFTQATTLDGSRSQYVVAERQRRIQGMFNFSGAPEKEQMGGDTSLWLTDFTYKVTLDVPTGAHMEYPIMVHNQLLDDKYIPKEPEDDRLHDDARSHSLRALHHFEVPRDIQRANPYEPPVKIPEHDDWLGDNAPPGMYPLVSALCQVDVQDNTYLLHLDELGEYHIDPEILEYFKKVEYRYLTLPFKSLYHVAHYRFKFLSTDRNVSVDSNLKVTTKKELSLRENNRICLFLLTDISAVDPACLKRMKRYPNVLRKTLKAMNVTYHQLVLLSPIIDLTGFMPELPKVGGLTKEQAFRNFTQFNTVQSAYVVSRDETHTGKIEDYKGKQMMTLTKPNLHKT